MLSRPAGSFEERIRVGGAWVAVALVAWQALAMLADVRIELSQPFERHVRVLRASPEELVRAKLGDDYEILEALRAHVPAGTRVLVSFLNERDDYHELRRRITWLESLVYPTVLAGWPLDPGKPRAKRGNAERREYVLDLESGRDLSIWKCEELARGAHFRQLLVGGAGG
jgi:hypothetical protein